MQTTDQYVYIYICTLITQGNMDPAFARGMDIFGQIPNAVSTYIIVHTYVRTWFLNSLLTWPSELLQTAIAYTL